MDRTEANTGTREVSERLRFDVAALERWMADHVDGFAGPLTVSQFKGGQSNPTYRLDTPTGRTFVLRRKPPGKLLPGAHAVDREDRVISALGAQGFPVPHVYGLCEDESVIGTPFFVMEMVEGRIVWEASFPGLTPAERAAHFDAMNATIAQLHSYDPAAIGLGDYGRARASSSGRWRAGRSNMRPMSRPAAWPRWTGWSNGSGSISARQRRRPHRPRRLPLRQHDLRARRAARRGGARLGAVDARRSGRRLRLPSDDVPHAGRHVHRPRRARPRRARHPDASRNMSRPIAAAPAATTCPTSTI